MQLNPQPFLGGAHRNFKHMANSFIQQVTECLFDARSLAKYWDRKVNEIIVSAFRMFKVSKEKPELIVETKRYWH